VFNSLLRNIADWVVAFMSVAPQSAAVGTINGSSLDRFLHNMPLTCMLHQQVGAVTGAPTTSSVITTLQHSQDNATWTTYLPDGVTAATTAALTAANSDNSLSIDLTLAQRFIRAVTTVAFTGGATPAVLVAVDLMIAGEVKNAAA
jgi:hypothetical protein